MDTWQPFLLLCWKLQGRWNADEGKLCRILAYGWMYEQKIFLISRLKYQVYLSFCLNALPHHHNSFSYQKDYANKIPRIATINLFFCVYLSEYVDSGLYDRKCFISPQHGPLHNSVNDLPYFRQNWFQSVLNHCTNRHEWGLGQCDHEPIPEDEDRGDKKR